MPRKARIDSPGALHHVIIRGIERRKIFRSDYDRENFVVRLSELIPETQTDCFAWALIPNHAHLLLRTGSIPVSVFMSHLLTEYAVWFNKKYRRHGQLFQNRYKSILCQEDPYLKELVRYIHLNPLRAGLVEDMKAKGYDFNRVAKRVAEVMGIKVEKITAYGKSPQTVKARSLLCFWAHRKLGMTTIDIGEKLKISQSAASRSSLRGEKRVDPSFESRQLHKLLFIWISDCRGGRLFLETPAYITAEKAILDTLYFRGSLPAPDELDLDPVDFEALFSMASKYSTTVFRMLTNL